MATAAELRAEVTRLRAILRTVSDAAAAEEIIDMIAELESQAKAKANGGAIN
jgi:hypothetical protein